MTEKKKRSTPRLIKLLILLVMAAVIIYAGIVGYVCIREGSVPTDVPDADNYDAIIVLGATEPPMFSLDGAWMPRMMLTRRKKCLWLCAERREKMSLSLKRKP